MNARKSHTRKLGLLVCFLTIAAGGFGTMQSAASASPASGYENYLLQTWGRADHYFKGTLAKPTLRIKIADRASDGHCVYAKATVHKKYASDLKIESRKVCGNGQSTTWSTTLVPGAGQIQGVTVYLCKSDWARDTCVKEYNAL